MVARVGPRQPVRGGIELGDEGGGVLLRGRAREQAPRDQEADAVGRVARFDGPDGQRLERGAEQGSRHPLARDVGDEAGDEAALGVDVDGVEISRHAARGHVAGEQLVAGHLGQARRQQRELDAACELELGGHPAPLRGLLSEVDHAQVQRRRRGERHQQLQVVLGELPHVQSRGEHDHAEHAAGHQQRRREHATHSRGEDARRAREALVDGGVEDQRRLAPLGHLAEKAAREEDLLGRQTRGPRHHLPEVAGLVEQQHRRLLGAEGAEDAVEDHLQQRRVRRGLGERLVDLVDQVEALGVVAQLHRGVVASRSARASSIEAASRNTLRPGERPGRSGARRLRARRCDSSRRARAGRGWPACDPVSGGR